MTSQTGILGLQVDALLEEVKRQEARRCQEIITAADRAARDLQEETRRELHRKRRQAVADERQRRRHALLEATSSYYAALRSRAKMLVNILMILASISARRLSVKLTGSKSGHFNRCPLFILSVLSSTLEPFMVS